MNAQGGTFLVSTLTLRHERVQIWPFVQANAYRGIVAQCSLRRRTIATGVRILPVPILPSIVTAKMLPSSPFMPKRPLFPSGCSLKFHLQTADLWCMAVAVNQICNPDVYSLEEAIRISNDAASASRAFELHIVQFLQAQCLSHRVPLRIVFRGLEVLGGLLRGGTSDENRLITLLRPFLKSSDPQIASKAVLILGRQSRNLMWLRSVMSETDERIRANLIESLWSRKEPEVEAVFRIALKDAHSRVVANSVYGLYLMGSNGWDEALNFLVSHPRPAFRRAAVWVIRSAAPPDAPAKLQSLIQDSDPQVRRAAFSALKHLRERKTARAA